MPFVVVPSFGPWPEAQGCLTRKIMLTLMRVDCSLSLASCEKRYLKSTDHYLARQQPLDMLAIPAPRLPNSETAIRVWCSLRIFPHTFRRPLRISDVFDVQIVALSSKKIPFNTLLASYASPSLSRSWHFQRRRRRTLRTDNERRHEW